jgi:general secretion pathway protein G
MVVGSKKTHPAIGRRDVRPEGMKSAAGFTLVELVLIIVVLGILAVVAIPKIGDIITGSKTNATKEEMSRLKGGIMGNSSVTSGGRLSDRGYRGDVGSFPPNLTGLVNKPGGVAAWNPYTRLGWNGPYIDSTGGEYLKDAWGTAYVYDSTARTITSTGSGSNIIVGF